MFEDSTACSQIHNAVWKIDDDEILKENKPVVAGSAEEFLLISQCVNSLQKNSPETRKELSMNLLSDDSSSSTLSDITLFHKESTVRKQTANHKDTPENKQASQLRKKTTTECTLELDFNMDDENACSNQINIINSPLEDSMFETYDLSATYTQMSIFTLQNENIEIFSSQGIDNITSYQQEDSAYDTNDLNLFVTDILEKDIVFDKVWQSGLFTPKISPYQKFDDATDSIKSERSRNSFVNTEYERTCGVKRKLEAAYETCDVFEENLKEEEKKISTQWLQYTLDALSVDDIAFQSVKVILSIFQNENVTRRYMRQRCWKNTLETLAVDAILNFCHVYEDENKTNACTQEIVQSVTKMLDKTIGSTELNKATHRISTILELCASTKVCIATINYLMTKLKCYEGVLISVMNGKKADIHNIVNQLHTTFYALNVCFLKYRLIFSNEDHGSEESTTVPVVDLWKRQLLSEGVMVEENARIRKKRWLMALDDFMVIATDNMDQFAEKSRRLVNTLICK